MFESKQVKHTLEESRQADTWKIGKWGKPSQQYGMTHWPVYASVLGRLLVFKWKKDKSQKATGLEEYSKLIIQWKC